MMIVDFKLLEHTCVPETTTVGLNADLNKALAALLAHGLDPEHGGVGVGTDHGDRVARLDS